MPIQSFTAIALALALARAPHAAEAPPELPRTFQTSKGTRLSVTSDLPRAEARKFLAHAEELHVEILKLLPGFGQRDGTPMTLYVFSKRQDYLDHLGAVGFDARNTAGIFTSHPDVEGLLLFTEDLERSEVFSTLRHEGFHQFCHTRIHPETPQWVNEGLAEWFGSSLLIKGRLHKGLVPRVPLFTVQKALEEDKAFPLPELLALSNEEWNSIVTRGDPRTGLMYAQSWSVVHFLIHAERGKYSNLLTTYLRAISQGRSQPQAFDAAFGAASLEPMENAWRAYVQALEPDPLSECDLRLRYLAYAIRALHDRGDRIESLDQLKSLCRDAGFDVRLTLPDVGTIAMKAEDDANFEAPPSDVRGKTSSMVLVPGKGDLPPSIEVRGLRALPRIAWRRDAEGVLEFEIEME